MVAPLFDMPVGTSSASGYYRRPDIVVNTPYHKVNEDSRFRYRFVDGFYESAQSTFTSPLVERRRNELMRRAQQVVERWNAVADQFVGISPQVFLSVMGTIAPTLINQEFTSITFEKTPDESLLITGDWRGKRVYLDIFFDEDEAAGYEAILNAYEQKQPVLTVAGTLDKVFTSLFGDSIQQPVCLFDPVIRQAV